MTRNKAPRAWALPTFLIVALGLGGTISACSGSSGHVVATFSPVPSATSHALVGDVQVIIKRLAELGVGGATATVQGGNVVIDSSTSLSSSTVQAVTTTGSFQVRPVTCYAPAYSGSPTSAPLPENCSAPQYDLTASNLQVDTSTQQPRDSPGPDPSLAAYPSSTSSFDNTHPDSTVLLPGAPGSVEPEPRYLLGSAGVTNDAVQSAAALYIGSAWSVLITLTGQGAVQWDELAYRQFHAYLAVDIDGQVESAPLNQPGQETFSSFQGKVQIAGNFTKETARDLAAVLNSGPLSVPLTRAQG